MCTENQEGLTWYKWYVTGSECCSLKFSFVFLKITLENGSIHLIFCAGIYELYIDFPHQKITIVGRADLEKIVKAIKKTRKIAVICSHTEQPDPPPPQPSEQPPEGGAPPPESCSPPPAEAAQPADQPPEETVKDPVPENQPAEEKQSPETAETAEMQTDQTSKPKEAEEVHVIYHYPPDYGYRYSYGPSSTSHGYGGQWNSQPSGLGFRAELPNDPRFRHEPQPSPVLSGYRQEPPPPIYVSHSYNSYKASPHVTRYEYVQSSPTYTHYGRPEHYTTTEDYYHYTDDYHNGNNNNNGNIDSVFSEENPNSCTIV